MLVEARLEGEVERAEAREGGHGRDVLGEAREQVPRVLDPPGDDAAAHVARVLAEDVGRVLAHVGAGVEQGGEDGRRGEGGGGDEGRHVGRVVVEDLVEGLVAGHAVRLAARLEHLGRVGAPEQRLHRRQVVERRGEREERPARRLGPRRLRHVAAPAHAPLELVQRRAAAAAAAAAVGCRRRPPRMRPAHEVGDVGHGDEDGGEGEEEAHQREVGRLLVRVELGREHRLEDGAHLRPVGALRERPLVRRQLDDVARLEVLEALVVLRVRGARGLGLRRADEHHRLVLARRELGRRELHAALG